MSTTGLQLTREQILAFRRRTASLDTRLPRSGESLRRAAWAGLQDSMPRAALLSIHARVEGTEPSALDDPSLVQIFGPRYSVYVVAAADVAVFTLGRLPDDAKRRRRDEDFAARVAEHLGPEPTRPENIGRILGVHIGNFRYASTTGTILIRWDGARRPLIYANPRPEVDPAAARLELARRYLHVYGPATPGAFEEWAGLSAKRGAAAFMALEAELVPVHTPAGEAWILAADEATVRAEPATGAPARLIPSGDSYTLLGREDRRLVVPDDEQRQALWTPRVWPGALLVGGEIAGTWRRAEAVVTVQTWRRLSRAERAAVEAEAGGLPLPGLSKAIVVRWED